MDLWANYWGAERSSRISPSGTSHSAANILIDCLLLVCGMFSNSMVGCFCYGLHLLATAHESLSHTTRPRLCGRFGSDGNKQYRSYASGAYSCGGAVVRFLLYASLRMV
jgi:hypothetical protein